MDLFSRTMLASSAEAGLTTTTLSRHVPLLRRNVTPTEPVALLTGCIGSDGLASGECLLMLTSDRIVVTRQSRLLGRIRPCLDAPVKAVENLRWSADPNGPGVELNFTAPDGPSAAAPHRWHFWLPASHAKRVWRIDALLARAFRRPQAVAVPIDGSQTPPKGPIGGSHASPKRPIGGVQAPPRRPIDDSQAREPHSARAAGFGPNLAAV